MFYFYGAHRWRRDAVRLINNNNNDFRDGFWLGIYLRINTFPSPRLLSLGEGSFIFTLFDRDRFSRTPPVNFVEPSILLYFFFFSYPLSDGFNDSGWLMRVIHHLKECHQLPRIRLTAAVPPCSTTRQLADISCKYIEGNTPPPHRRCHLPPPTTHQSNPALTHCYRRCYSKRT